MKYYASKIKQWKNPFLIIFNFITCFLTLFPLLFLVAKLLYKLFCLSVRLSFSPSYMFWGKGMGLIYTAAIKDSALKISLKNTIYFVRLSVGHPKDYIKILQGKCIYLFVISLIFVKILLTNEHLHCLIYLVRRSNCSDFFLQANVVFLSFYL